MNQEQEISQLKQQVAKYESMNSYQDDEIDLRELWNVVWQGKWKVIVITLVFSIASIFYALSLPNIYQSEALLMSNSQGQSSSGLSSLTGQFGGLASLAGISLGGSTDKVGYAIELLKSREFLYKFIENNDLKVSLMATDGWIRETNAFTFDEDLYDEHTNNWVRKVKRPYKAEPSLQEAYEKFLKDNLSVSQDKKSGMVRITVEHYSPYLAKKLVDKLVEAINTTIKQQDMTEAIKSIEYFEAELQNTNFTGTQTMFYQLIEQQQQTLMLTKVRNDYVLKVVDRPVVAEEKSKPKRALICLLITFIGSLLSVVYVFFAHRSSIRKQ